MNLNLELKLPTVSDLKRLIPLLRRSQTIIVGIVLIALFGYTAYIVQIAVNVKAGDTTASSAVVHFDQPTLTNLQQRTVVDGSTDPGTLGTDNPFGN